jgi:AbrB family looped-hinge helix DNA binding protein
MFLLLTSVFVDDIIQISQRGLKRLIDAKRRVQRMKEKSGAGCCGPQAAAPSACCKVEALITIDARGQIVLPKDVREGAQIQPGDKLAVISFQKEGTTCCIVLMKADTFALTVKDLLGPMMNEIMQE